MNIKGGNAHSPFLKSHRNYCYNYGGYWRVMKNNVYYGSYASFEDAKKVSDKLKECNWDKSKLETILNEVNVTPRTRLNFGESGIFNVHIKRDDNYKQGYTFTYPYIENGKHKILSSISIDKLKEKVEDKNLEWYG